MRRLYPIICVVILMAGILVFSVPSFASPIPAQFDKITLTNSGNGLNGGGVFTWSQSNQGNSPYTLSTFCVETQAHISPGSTYTIYDISSDVLKQGNGTIGKLQRNTDALAYLFSTKQLSDYKGTTEENAALQRLVWDYQKQDTSAVSYYNKTLYNLYKNQVELFLTGNTNTSFGSVILNIGVLQADRTYSDNQSQIWNPGTPVPEPSTLLLFGAGLLGLAVKFRRK
jgi:hypothetical protein